MDSSRRRFLGSRKPGLAPCRPPWSSEEAIFVSRCNRCDDCVKACPTRLLARGEGGFPFADFLSAACSFCGECARVCTTGAIDSRRGADPWKFTIRIGADCLALRRVECRVCGEACAIGAVRFLPRRGGVATPDLDASVCTGCGACVAPCPAGAISRTVLIAPVHNISLVAESS